MMHERSRIAILQRYLPHYRRVFFTRLAEANPDLDIRLYHGGALVGDGDTEPLEGPIAERRVRNARVLPRLGYDLVVQRGAIFDVLRERYEVLVLEGTFRVLSNTVLLVARHLRGQPTLYWSAGWDRPGIMGRRHRLKTAAVRALVSRADGWIAYGSAAREYLVAHGAD